MKDVTFKQVLMLYVLVCLLVIVVGVKYLILPQNDEKVKTETTYSETQQEYDQLAVQGNYAQIYQNRNEEMKSEISEILPECVGDFQNEDIDKKITTLITSFGLTVEDLFISDPVVYAATPPTATNNGAATSATTTTTTITTTAVTTTTASGNNAAATTTTTTQMASENVKVSTLNVKASGKYDNLVRLINNVKTKRGITLSNVSFSTDENESLSNMTMTFDIQVFIYDNTILKATAK